MITRLNPSCTMSQEPAQDPSPNPNPNPGKEGGRGLGVDTGVSNWAPTTWEKLARRHPQLPRPERVITRLNAS